MALSCSAHPQESSPELRWQTQGSDVSGAGVQTDSTGAAGQKHVSLVKEFARVHAVSCHLFHNVCRVQCSDPHRTVANKVQQPMPQVIALLHIPVACCSAISEFHLVMSDWHPPPWHPQWVPGLDILAASVQSKYTSPKVMVHERWQRGHRYCSTAQAVQHVSSRQDCTQMLPMAGN